MQVAPLSLDNLLVDSAYAVLVGLNGWAIRNTRRISQELTILRTYLFGPPDVANSGLHWRVEQLEEDVEALKGAR